MVLDFVTEMSGVQIAPPYAAYTKPNSSLIRGPKEQYLSIGIPLYEAAIKGNWKAANAILSLKDNKDLVRTSITENGETALHVAASAKGKNVEEFVKNLVDMMDEKDLELVNRNYNTALYLAAKAGNVETVKIMMKKNRNLQTMSGDNEMLPLYAAVLFGNYDVAKYLYQESKGLSVDCWTDLNRGWLLEKCVENDMFDIALEIVKKYPVDNSGAILSVLARKPESFGETKSNIIRKTIKLIFTFMGSRLGVDHEKKNQALSILRIVWKDIAKMRNKDIDMILRGPRDSVNKSTSGRMVQAIQLKKLINDHLDRMENKTKNIIATQGTNLTSGELDHVHQLKNLISEYIVNLHLTTQEIVKQDNTPLVGKRDQVLELEKLISNHIVSIHDGTQDIIVSIHYGTQDIVGKAQKIQELISKNIEELRAKAYFQETYSSRVLFLAAEAGNTTFIAELIRQYPDLIWKKNDNGLSIFHIAVKYRHEGIYTLLHEIGAMKDWITPLRDEHENNMLHLVGKPVNRCP